MNVIVPLAGPDFVNPDGTLKADEKVDGDPILLATLKNRPWTNHEGLRYFFVLHDVPETRQFASGWLIKNFPDASITFISDYSRGAAMTALAGASLIKVFDTPLIIDLADIIYKSDLKVEDQFSSNTEVDAIAMTFQSDNPLYSYLELDGSNKVCRAVEKSVISSNASAGTYIYRNVYSFMNALAHCLASPSQYSYRDLMYVCPVYNGVIAGGGNVLLSEVKDVRDVKVNH